MADAETKTATDVRCEIISLLRNQPYRVNISYDCENGRQSRLTGYSRDEHDHKIDITVKGVAQTFQRRKYHERPHVSVEGETGVEHVFANSTPPKEILRWLSINSPKHKWLEELLNRPEPKDFKFKVKIVVEYEEDETINHHDLEEAKKMIQERFKNKYYDYKHLEITYISEEDSDMFRIVKDKDSGDDE